MKEGRAGKAQLITAILPNWREIHLADGLPAQDHG